MPMIWTIAIDADTALAATAHPIPLAAAIPALQFGGYHFNPNAGGWPGRVLPPRNWPAPPIMSSPAQIIDCFGRNALLEGLALVVSWGTMGRTAPHIYGPRLRDIQDALAYCKKDIGATATIQKSWDILTSPTGTIKWTSTMASKTLHFLCRSLGHSDNPPVPIDSTMRKAVWNAFSSAIIPPTAVPGNWHGDSYDAYCRYMTAILKWADPRKWTTTEMETTIFSEYR